VGDEAALPACPKDGGTLTVVEKRDLLEDLTKVADQMSTTVEMISKDSEEGQLLLRAFGGVAAILRYRVT
jgi:peptide chain release factor subunit 1